MVKQNYKTEQRKELLEFMEKNTNNFVNADDIEVISVDDYMYGPKGILYSNGKLLISEMENTI